MKELMLIMHFTGLAMGLGTGFANAFLGAMADRMAAGEATKFRLQILGLSKMGYIGVGLLIVSGLYLVSPYWSVLHTMPLLLAKLVLVALLILLIVLIGVAGRKARLGDEDVQFRKMERIGKLALVTGVAIIVLAAFVFH